jgi:hypothetical protein
MNKINKNLKTKEDQNKFFNDYLFCFFGEIFFTVQKKLTVKILSEKKISKNSKKKNRKIYTKKKKNLKKRT